MARTMSPLPSLLKTPTPKLFSLLSASPLSLSPPRGLSPSRTLTLPRKSSSLSPSSLSSSFNFSPQHQHRQQEFNGDDEEEDEELVIGDCVVFEEGAFEDPYLHQTFDSDLDLPKTKSKSAVEVKPEDLVPEKWKEVQAEINITKKERRRIAREMEFGNRVEKRKQGLVPIRNVRVEDYVAYRDENLKQLNPVGVDNPRFLEEKHEKDVKEVSRVTPRNPRLAVYGGTLDDISAFFSSGNYDPNAAQNPEGHRKLFSKEEKVLLNRRMPELSAATSGKWLPLHSLVASGEFYLVNALLKHDVAINIQDKEGATLMHHAVRTASSQMIKILLLYNVDINLQDNDGWTPLHLAVQTRRTDIVRLLLIKGADKTLKNQDGLTPLDLCLYCGQDTRTYELIKLMKQPPKPRKSFNYSLKEEMLIRPTTTVAHIHAI
ncbi:ankyrin repeat protein [Actinidia rufa]|uniref:Ankyrin repeat protein n=1 Tax=Actinidia rufa TaxID=165716 RepID=A0A7J0E1L2_9ERIC|nr:ankyrin repeat protein [Actinidia rufa]